MPYTLQPHLDRRSDLRGRPEKLSLLWQAESARVVLVDGSTRVLVRPTGGELDVESVCFIGTDGEGAGWFASRVDAAALDALGAAQPLRSAHLSAVELEAGQAAAAVLAWHDIQHFCERCASPTTMVPGGFSRVCLQGHELFPRTDPAMIVAVLDADDRLLLGHQSSWPSNRVSVLAGFLEAGESAEHAVVREVAEEVGLRVSATRYLASQAWPFPRSLMMGFVARAEGAITTDDQEIAWARWFRREELACAEAHGEVVLPHGNAIASRMIELWRAGSLPAPEGNELFA